MLRILIYGSAFAMLLFCNKPPIQLIDASENNNNITDNSTTIQAVDSCDNYIKQILSDEHLPREYLKDLNIDETVNRNLQLRASGKQQHATSPTILEPIYFGPSSDSDDSDHLHEEFIDLLSQHQPQPQSADILPNSFYSLDNSQQQQQQQQQQQPPPRNNYNLQQPYNDNNYTRPRIASEEIYLKSFGLDDNTSAINNNDNQFGTKLAPINSSDYNVIRKIQANTGEFVNNSSGARFSIPITNGVVSTGEKNAAPAQSFLHANAKPVAPVKAATTQPNAPDNYSRAVPINHNKQETFIQRFSSHGQQQQQPPPIHRVVSSLTIPASQAILAQKSKSLASSEPGRGGAKISTVSVEEIENLLRRLKPLAVNENEKAQSERVGQESESAEAEEDGDDDDDGEQEEEDNNNGNNSSRIVSKNEFDVLKRGKDLDRVLPTSHIFRGSGVVSESRLSESNPSSDAAGADEQQQQLDFVKALSALGSSLSEASGGDGDSDGHGDGHSPGTRGSERFYDDRGSSSPREEGQALLGSGSQLNERDQSLSMPLHELVDHLMASSRMATFGVQHDGSRLPQEQQPPRIGFIQMEQEDDDGEDETNPEDEEQEEEDGEGEGEGDEDDDDDDRDNNGTLEAANPSESAPVEVMASGESIGFNSVFGAAANNSSDSWIPLNSIGTRTRIKPVGQDHSGDKRIKPKRKKRKKKSGQQQQKRRRKKRKALGLVIGDRVLSQSDVIKLIGILNKMASRKEASKEREAARKLLRFLIKLTLDEYKRSQAIDASNKQQQQQATTENSKNSKDSEMRMKKRKTKKRTEEEEEEDNSRDSIRDLLRSILLGPSGNSSPSDDDGASNSGQRRDDRIELRPYEIKPAPDGGRRLAVAAAAAAHLDGGDQSGGGGGEQQAYKQRQQQQLKVKKQAKGNKLNKISEDLEQYFDKDFFEDLANQPANPTNEIGRGGDREEEKKGNNSSGRLSILVEDSNKSPSNDNNSNNHKRRRAAAAAAGLSYSLPVPIYGRQQLEAADEDDVDLDYVRLANKNSGPPRGAVAVDGRRRLKGRRGRRSKERAAAAAKGELARMKQRRRDEGDKDDDNDDTDDDGDGDGEQGDERRARLATAAAAAAGSGQKPLRDAARRQRRRQQQQQPLHGIVQRDQTQPEAAAAAATAKQRPKETKVLELEEADEDDNELQRPELDDVGYGHDEGQEQQDDETTNSKLGGAREAKAAAETKKRKSQVKDGGEAANVVRPAALRRQTPKEKKKDAGRQRRRRRRSRRRTKRKRGHSERANKKEETKRHDGSGSGGDEDDEGLGFEGAGDNKLDGSSEWTRDEIPAPIVSGNRILTTLDNNTAQGLPDSSGGSGSGSGSGNGGDGAARQIWDKNNNNNNSNNKMRKSLLAGAAAAGGPKANSTGGAKATVKGEAGQRSREQPALLRAKQGARNDDDDHDGRPTSTTTKTLARNANNKTLKRRRDSNNSAGQRKGPPKGAAAAAAATGERARQKAKMKQQQQRAEEAPDYYDEGTSFVKVCEGDNQCEVTVKSSSPKLSEAIEARDESTIARHLNRISSEPD